MRAFHGDPAIKAKYIARVQAHRAADELIRGVGWEDGKGCAVGCTLDAYDHARYPVELGVPEMLARLEDVIHEGLPNDQALEWPEWFLLAIPVGADLERVGWQFLVWLLRDSGIGAFDDPAVKDAVAQCAAAIEPLATGGRFDAAAAASAAEGTVESARRAARSAAWSVESTGYAAWSAELAAWSAWYADESTAWSADSAWYTARSAWYTAWSVELAVRSTGYADESAMSAAYVQMAEKLIALLKEAR